MSELDSYKATAESLASKNVMLRCFLLRLLDPDDLGHSINQEVRQLIQQLLNTNPRQAPTKGKQNGI